jgi:hypothetical protein
MVAGETAVTGILKIAYKLLVNDKAKFTALLVGITFAVFLIVQMVAMFAGSMKRASATVINNTGAWSRSKPESGLDNQRQSRSLGQSRSNEFHGFGSRIGGGMPRTYSPGFGGGGRR